MSQKEIQKELISLIMLSCSTYKDAKRRAQYLRWKHIVKTHRADITYAKVQYILTYIYLINYT